MKRLNQILKDFSSAIDSLKQAVKEGQSELEIDGCLQRFEFTFELCWKSIKRFLDSEGILCRSPRQCLKEAYAYGLIKDEKTWLLMMEDRNSSTHLYDRKISREIFNRIQSTHLKEFEELFKKIIPRIPS